MRERLVPRARPDDDLFGAERRLQEANESTEYTPSAKVLAEFLNLTKTEVETFKERLQRARGHVRIWVHPLYAEQYPGSAQGRLGNAKLADVQNKLKTSFFKTVRSVARNLNSSPLIVYETMKKLEETRILLATYLKCRPDDLARHGIIFVPTEVASSELDQVHLVKSLQSGDEDDKGEAEKIIELRKATEDYIKLGEKYDREFEELLPSLSKDPFTPLSPNEQDLYVELVARQTRDMKPIFDRCMEARSMIRLKSNMFILSLYRRMGLRSALISGAYLEVVENRKTKKSELHACAGMVVNSLRDANIPTDISNNIWPPKELISSAGFEIKQTKRRSNS